MSAAPSVVGAAPSATAGPTCLPPLTPLERARTKVIMTVSVLGGHQTDFARNLTREGGDFADLFADTVRATLDAAGIAPGDVDVIHVGNAFGQLFTGQGHLGAMPATIEPALWGVPAVRHEAACASGSMALLAATAELEAGRYDVALVLGAEIETQRARRPGRAAPRRGRARRPRGRRGALHVAVHVPPARRGVRPPLRPRRSARARDRRAQHRATRARTRTRRPATGRSPRRASPTTTRRTRRSRDGCAAPTAGR